MTHHHCGLPALLTTTTTALHLLHLLQLHYTYYHFNYYQHHFYYYHGDYTRYTTTFYKKAGGTPTSAMTCQPRPAPHLRGRGRRLHNLTAATISYSAAARANESSVLDRISITCTLVIHRPRGIASKHRESTGAARARSRAAAARAAWAASSEA
jgi:hypothetical protein